MPLLTTVLDDKSPLISYDQTWFPGNSQDDNFTTDYYLGTHQKNSVANGRASFSFNGTACWIYGSHRPSHGTFAVQVDSSNFPNISGTGNYLFQQQLFTTNLSQGMHTVSLINTGTPGQFLDLDMVVWQSEVGNAGDQLVPEVIQDEDFRFQYHQSAWQTTSASSNLNLNLFNNGTGQAWSSSDTLLPFKLTVQAGEAVTLFGTSGPSNGPYSVQLDGSPAVHYSASNAYPTNYGVPIYHADNLGPGIHQINLTNLPDSSDQYLTIDYAQVWTIAGESDSLPPSAPCVPSSNVISKNKISSGTIAGLVVEGVVTALAVAAAFFFYRRWKAALAVPPTQFIPRYQSPETTTVTGIALSLLTRSNPSLHQNNTFQPLAAVPENTTPPVPSQSSDAPIVAEGANSPGLAQKEGQTSGRRLLPDAPGPQPAGAGQADSRTRTSLISTSDPPPEYNVAVQEA